MALVPACGVPVPFQIIMKRTPKRDFVFIDETGDPGNDFSNGGSIYFAVGCLQMTDLSLEQLHKHLFAMGYFSGRFRELKSSRLSRLQKDQIEDIAKWLCAETDISITVVLIDKSRYCGPYFGLEGRVYNPLHLRNFLTRQLLEHHFKDRGLITAECELVFDRAMAESAEENLKAYLRGNFLLPSFSSIVQCDSRYVVGLQFADAIVHIVKEYVFGSRGDVDGRLLSCVRVVDVSDPRAPQVVKT